SALYKPRLVHHLATRWWQATAPMTAVPVWVQELEMFYRCILPRQSYCYWQCCYQIRPRFPCLRKAVRQLEDPSTGNHARNAIRESRKLSKRTYHSAPTLETTKFVHLRKLPHLQNLAQYFSDQIGHDYRLLALLIECAAPF